MKKTSLIKVSSLLFCLKFTVSRYKLSRNLWKLSSARSLRYVRVYHLIIVHVRDCMCKDHAWWW